MGDSRAGRADHGGGERGVFLLPFAIPDPFDAGGVPADVLARRLPDLLHLLLNGGPGGPVGMLEVQSPPGDGPPRWVTLSSAPSPDEVLPMLDGGPADALVVGELREAERGLRVELTVHRVERANSEAGSDDLDEVGNAGFGAGFDAGIDDEEPSWHRTESVHAVLAVDDPAGGLLRLAGHLAQVLELPFRAPEPGFLGRVPETFFHLLRALDGGALIAGEPDLEPERYGEELLRPLVDALQADPGCGLALRLLAQLLFPVLQGERVAEAVCLRVLDACLACAPTDGEGCVDVSDQLGVLGQPARSRAWLEHAASLDDPPSRAIESLGVQLANAGDVDRARELWRRGMKVDGHPDFFAHLARLAFTEGRRADAWDLLLRGLHRKHERTLRAAEWDDDGRGASALLRYASEHVGDEGPCPPDVDEALVDLAGQLDDPIEQADLGLALRALGHGQLAERELREALEADLSPAAEDRAVRAMLGLQVPDFERKFSAASERAERGRDPRRALVEMQAFLERQPAFWPALLYTGIALRRLGRQDEALDVLAEVAQRRPDEKHALFELAEMFDRRGNPKRALEFVDQALGSSPSDVDLHLLRAQCLEHLGRAAEAGAALDRAIELEPRRRRRRRRA